MSFDSCAVVHYVNSLFRCLCCVGLSFYLGFLVCVCFPLMFHEKLNSIVDKSRHGNCELFTPTVFCKETHEEIKPISGCVSQFPHNYLLIVVHRWKTR